jgi:glucoamylase
MPRDLPVGNSRLLVCFDQDYHLRELYFPHVGQENHVNGNLCRFGVYAEPDFSWVGPDWKRELNYEEDTLVTRVDLYHPGLELLLTCRDAVDFHEDIFLREISVENLRSEPRRVELFLSQDFDISGNSIGDTAIFDPQSGGVVHYKGSRYFLINGLSAAREGISQFAVGVKKVEGREGTFRDAEDGILSGNTVAQGSVDSVVSLVLNLPGHGQEKAYYWICVGKELGEVRRADSLVKRKKPLTLLKRTGDYWRLYVRKESPQMAYLPEKVARLYRRSLLVLRTQIDWEGGILAANDSDVVLYNRDTYSYIWPRDGALVAHALDLAGYPIPAQEFYRFASRVIGQEGFLLHKYNPDGTLASSWHPWHDGREVQLPIQEDSTALVVWALWQHFVLSRDIEFIKPLYRTLIKGAANFMVAYRDRETGLPGPSHDLWEERRGILGFTTGAVFGGLTAASLFCTVFGEEEKAVQYRQAAAEIRDGASRYLWREDWGRFCRMVSRNKEGLLEADGTHDSSLWGLFAFGLYAPDDDRIKATMQGLREKLWVRTGCGGMARYENDPYYRTSPEVPGNPWFISTLWLADFLIRNAREDHDLEEALQILSWVSDRALPSGVLAEQIHPYTCAPLSVSPLTWSHGTLVAVIQQIIRYFSRKSGTPLERMEDWIGHLYVQACDSIYGTCAVK